MSDLISRADAIEAVRWETSKLGRGLLGKGDILDIIEALPSAEQHNKDAISREGLLRSWEELSPRGRTEFDQVIMTIPALPSAETHEIRTETHGVCLISKDDAIDAVMKHKMPFSIQQEVAREIDALPSADAVDCTDFIEWLVDRVLDETIWEYNSVAYGEIICRKLEKLGILEATEEPSYYIRPSADAVPQLRQTDTLIIADALRYLAKDTERHLVDRTRADALRQQFLKYGASMCKGGAE